MQKGAIYYKKRVYSGNADVTHYVLGDFATVEDSTTASKAYKVGEFLLNDKFGLLLSYNKGRR